MKSPDQFNGFKDYLSLKKHCLNKRFKIQPVKKSSFDFFFSLYSNIELMKYIREPMNHNTAYKLFFKVYDQMQHSNPQTYLFQATDFNGATIGIIGIKKQTVKNEFEIGVVLDPFFHGQGFSFEIKITLIRWMFQQSKDLIVTAYCHPKNIIPNLVNKKIGFKLDGLGDYFNYKSQMNKWSLSYVDFRLLYT